MEQTKTKAKDSMYHSKTNYVGDVPENEYQVSDTPTKYLNSDQHYIHRNIPVGDSIATQEMGRVVAKHMDAVNSQFDSINASLKDIGTQLNKTSSKIDMALLVLGVDEQGKPTGNGIKGELARINIEQKKQANDIVALNIDEVKNSTSINLLFKLVYGTFGASIVVLFETIMTHIMK